MSPSGSRNPSLVPIIIRSRALPSASSQCPPESSDLGQSSCRDSHQQLVSQDRLRLCNSSSLSHRGVFAPSSYQTPPRGVQVVLRPGRKSPRRGFLLTKGCHCSRLTVGSLGRRVVAQGLARGLRSHKGPPLQQAHCRLVGSLGESCARSWLPRIVEARQLESTVPACSFILANLPRG